MANQQSTVMDLPGPPEACITNLDLRHGLRPFAVVTRYASLDASSLDAAIRDGLRALHDGMDDDGAAASDVYVFFRNRHGETVTVDIALPLESAMSLRPSEISIKKMPRTAILSIRPKVGTHGLMDAMDRVAQDLGLSSRAALPPSWQRFPLPFAGYQTGSILDVAGAASGLDRDQNGGVSSS